MMSRPRIGEVCGCGEPMMPGGGVDGQFGPIDGSDPNFGRRTRGLGFIALLTNEIEGFGAIGRLKAFLGIRSAEMAHLSGGPAPRHYTESEIATQVEWLRGLEQKAKA